jgi:hypothetical protein
MPTTTRRAFKLIAIDLHYNMDDYFANQVRGWERYGWRQMVRVQEDAIWEKYRNQFAPKNGPMETPHQSITWDISTAYLNDAHGLRALEDDFAGKVLEVLQQSTRPGEELYALDWQHRCYFFDPRYGVANADKQYWAVPFVPTYDPYVFLASDFRFGIISDWHLKTMCIFGQELLDGFQKAAPKILSKPSWSSAQRSAMEKEWEARGWMRLQYELKDEVWDKFNSRFEFWDRFHSNPPIGIREPTPSVTWDIAAISDGDTALHEKTSLLLLEALKKATPRGEVLYSLDAVRAYENYTFDPHRLTSAARDSWALPLLPLEHYSVFLAVDFCFGLFGNPREKTICVFGEDLLSTIQSWDVGVRIRRDGRPHTRGSKPF